MRLELMIPAIMLVCSVWAVGQFLIAYCRSLLAASDVAQISEQVREVAGLSSLEPAPSEFRRLLVLARMSGAPAIDANEMCAVKSYYRVLSFAKMLIVPFSRGTSLWFQNELGRCTRFAAISLDRRLLAVPAIQQ
jgi:hypothetical protein